jgi:hypothetical protein
MRSSPVKLEPLDGGEGRHGALARGEEEGEHETGCKHTRALHAGPQARKAMERFAAGLRWGRKIRAGEVCPSDDEEEQNSKAKGSRKRRKVGCGSVVSTAR